MTKIEIRQIVLDIIAEVAPDEDLSDIVDTEPLKDQAGLDSMDFLDIVLELRKLYQIDVPEDDYTQLATLSSTVEYLQDKFPAA